MTDETRRAIANARSMQESINELGAGKRDTTLGVAMGKVLVKSLDYAYNNGRADARVEIEKAIAALPIRTRQGVELIERGATLRIIHDLDSE